MSEEIILDDQDRRLLRYFQDSPGASAAELAERAGVSGAAGWRRLERMRAAGIIKGVEARINWAALGYAVEVSLRVTLDKGEARAFDDFLVAARGVPEVIEIQTFLGRVDVRLSVLARDMAHYEVIYRDRILGLPHIADIEALMLVKRLHHDEALPL